MAAVSETVQSRTARRARWAKRIAQWEASGETQKAYCARRGWALSTFQWHRAQSKGAKPGSAVAVPFLPLTLAPKEAAAVEVELSSKTRIRFEGALAERAIDRLLARIR